MTTESIKKAISDGRFTVNQLRQYLCESAIEAELDDPADFVINAIRHGVTGYDKMSLSDCIPELLDHQEMTDDDDETYFTAIAEMPDKEL